MPKKVSYQVQSWKDVVHCDCGISFKNFQEATKHLKEMAEYYGEALITKHVWEDRKIVKTQTGVLKSDGTFRIL